MFDFLKRKKAEPQANLSNPDEWLLDALLRGTSSSGVKVTPVTALGISSVYACVNVISKTLASLPLCIYEQTAEGNVNAYDHPLYNLLTLQPNSTMTISEVVGTLVANLTLRGNSYALLSRDGLGNVRQIMPVEPSDIQLLVDPNTNQIDYRIDG